MNQTATARQSAPFRATTGTRPNLRLVTTETNSGAEPDETLLSRIAEKDERALGMLFDRHGQRAYALALAILGETADAEEAVGDAFAQVWRGAVAFDLKRGSVLGWITTITRSRSLDRLRRRRRDTAGMDLVLAAPDGAMDEFLTRLQAPPDALVEADELRRQVEGALHGLSIPQREVIYLTFFRGLSQTEIATALGTPLGTVKTRVRAALEKLRMSLASLRASGNH